MDEFYIGWQEKAPPGISRFLKRVVPLIVLAGLSAIVVVFLGSRDAFAPSVFEFGNVQTFEGILSEHPYPTLLVDRPRASGPLPAFSRYYLVGEGKFGADEDMLGLDGQRVRFAGTLIYRDDQTMIEVVGGSVEAVAGNTAATAATESLGTHTLRGEIVDSKCFFGVMNPGHLKPHRACATRCISGGIPPVLVVRDGQGNAVYFLLQDAAGEAVNDRVLDKIAEPVEITGEVMRLDNLLVLRANPDTYRAPS